MNFNKKNLTNKHLIRLYKQLIKPRLIEEKMLLLLRQGKITKWFSGIGQEAISVGAAMAMNEEEYILPMHRNLGVFTARDIPLDKLFAQFQGKEQGFTKGRDRSFHFGSKPDRIIGMISHLGAQLAVANGIGLAEKLESSRRGCIVFCGDGGASEGDFHEALNVAAVWKLPVIFLIENNGYSISTPTNQQFNLKSFTEKGPAYGMATMSIDGNNILEVYHSIYQAIRNIRRTPKPILIEANTFRMRGHEESSGTDYVPEELFKEWAEKDPVDNYEDYLLNTKVLKQSEVDEIIEEISEEIDNAIDTVFNQKEITSSPEKELSDIYRSHTPSAKIPDYSHSKKLRYVDAINEGLQQSMKKHENLVLMGQDIAEFGGVFKVTEGLFQEFGEDRVRNTPLCESAIIGSGLGLAIRGYKSIVEMQFSDFVTCGFNQIVNNLAKSHYRWGQNADVVIRMPSGAGLGAGPFHSQSTESWFFRVPGLKLVYPSTPQDAKGLLIAAVNDPNPVMYFEHKYLYRSLSDNVPEEYYETPIGKARLAQKGEDLTIVTYGLGVSWAEEICKEEDIDAEIIDLRTLLPWDKDAVAESVKKTGRAIVLNEDTLTGSISGEIAAWIGENLFENLDAPVMREGALDTPIPFAKNLEQQFLPKERFKTKLKKLADY